MTTNDASHFEDVLACGSCGSAASSPAGAAQGVPLRRCDGCGTTRFTRVAPPEVVYGDGYHTGTGEYGFDWTTADTQAYELAVNDRRVEWLEARVPRGRIADVGGGLGFFAAAASRRGWDATLIEPVTQATAYAREVLGVTAVNAGVDHLGSVAEPFDVVALQHVLEHFRQPLEILRSIRPAIRAGGALLVEVPNLGSLGRRLDGDDWMGWQAGEHIHLFDRGTLADLVRRAGYRVEVVDTFVPGWPGLVPEGYAHFLGLVRLLHRAVRYRRRLTHAVRRTGNAGDPAEVPIHENVAVDQMQGARGAVYRAGFNGLAALEERTHLGTNIRLLARRD